jgi:hypothetical protein
MMAESPEDLRPTPDPTLLTTAQLLRQVAAERDYVDGQIGVLRERLSGIDKATELLNETVNRVPTDVQVAIGNLQALTDEKFESIQKQFVERDTRSERESKDNKTAVDAAFAAADKAADERNKSNTLAISKSETATTETINKLAELFKTTTDALGDKIDDLKERVGRIEATRLGAVENRHEMSTGVTLALTLAGVVLTVIIVGLALSAALHK